MQSICRFVTSNKSPEPIQTLNFVYETNNFTKDKNVTEAIYKACIVASGEATVCIGSVRVQISKDDVFFLIPAVPYSITASDDFTFMYISFMGIRAGIVMERLDINRRNFVFKNFPELSELWKQSISFKSEITDLTSEGLLMYTISTIGNRLLETKENTDDDNTGNNLIAIKRYIDTNFSDPELSLEKISSEFSYNKNYISAAFKKTFKMGMREYLNMIRINNACVLMEQSNTNIEEIAYLCGYSDRVYFSKIFKKKMGVSPKQYIKRRFQHE